MIDLLIAYLNFLILSIKYIVKVLAFRPPNPKGVRIIENKEKKDGNSNINDNTNIEILFSIPIKKENENKQHNPSDLDKDKNIIKKVSDKPPPENKQKIERKLEYKLATDKYSSFQLVYLECQETKTKIPAFIFRPKDYYQFNCIIIYCHGNSGDIGTSFIECQILSRNLRCDVLSFEYPGYGLSNDFDNINERCSYLYVRRAYKYAKDQLGYSPQNIILYGFSLGTGIAFDLACDKKYPNGGVILQSPFLSIIRIFYNFNKTYYFDIFNSCDKAKYCESMIYIIHGNKDSIVPYIHGRILAKLIPEKNLYGFYTVPDANHNDLIKFAREQLYFNITNFIYDMVHKNQYFYDDHNIRDNPTDTDKEKENKDKKSSVMDISSINSEDKLNGSSRKVIKEKPKKIEIDENENNVSSKEKLNGVNIEMNKSVKSNQSNKEKHELSCLFPKADNNDTLTDPITKNVDTNDIKITIHEKK